MEHSYEGIHPSYTPSRGFRDRARRRQSPTGRRMGTRSRNAGGGDPWHSRTRLFCPGPARHRGCRRAHAGLRSTGVRALGTGPAAAAPRRFVSDVVELLDAFGIERVPVIGWSGGGSCTLACGAFASERVTSVAAVCSPGEATERDAPPDAVALRKQVAADPEAHRNKVRPRFAQWLEEDLTGVFDEMVVEYPEVFAVPGMREAATAEAHEAGASGIEGYIDDLITQCLGWGFELTDVRVPVVSWYGEQDQNSSRSPPRTPRGPHPRLPVDGLSPVRTLHRDSPLARDPR